MECSGHSRWFERLLDELGFELRIGDPAEIQVRRVRKQKTDRQDAQLLLRLLMENRFPRMFSLLGRVREANSLRSPGFHGFRGHRKRRIQIFPGDGSGIFARHVWPFLCAELHMENNKTDNSDRAQCRR